MNSMGIKKGFDGGVVKLIPVVTLKVFNFTPNLVKNISIKM